MNRDSLRTIEIVGRKSPSGAKLNDHVGGSAISLLAPDSKSYINRLQNSAARLSDFAMAKTKFDQPEGAFVSREFLL